MPINFDPDPKKRELAYLGTNQRLFDRMDQHAQARWLNHMADAVVEQKNSPNWTAFRHAAAAAPEPRPWPTQKLDTAIIKLWPLVKKHHWSAAQLLHVLSKVLQPADLAPVLAPPDQGGLADPSPCLADIGPVPADQNSKIKNQKSLAVLVAYCNNTLSLRWSGTRNSTPQNQKSLAGVSERSLAVALRLFKSSVSKRPILNSDSDEQARTE